MKTQYTDFKSSLEVHKEIAKQTNRTRIIPCAALIIAGITALVVGIGTDIETVSITTPLIGLGILLTIAGLWLLFKQKSHWVYGPTRCPLRIGQIVLERDQMKIVIKAIYEGDFSLLNQTKENAMGGIKLDYAVTNDGSFGMVQIAIYEECNFIPTSDVIVLEGNQAKSLARFCSR